MRLLLDTHVALWLIAGDRRLTRHARALVNDAETVSVSAVSFVEIAIKHARGSTARDPITLNARQARRAFLDAGLIELPLTAAHAEALDTLPPLHRDPFDRMLIAQAMSEPMRLLTHDAAMTAYGELVVAV